MGSKRNSLGSLLVLLLLFFGMLAFYFLFYKPEITKKEKSDSVSLFENFNKQDVHEIDIQFIDGTNVYKTRLENVSNRWKILYPVVEEAEENSVFRILEDIPGIKSSKVYRNVDSGKLKEYGFLNPRISLKMSFKDSNSIELFVGDKTPAEDFYYAMIGSNSNIVYLVYAYKFLSIEKKTDDFRKKEIFSIQPQSVDKLVIEEKGKKPLIFMRLITNQVETYEAISPVKRKLDNFKVKTFLMNITSLSISHFYYGKLDDYAMRRYGLFGGGINITLYGNGGKDIEKLTIGREFERGFRSAFHHQKKMLFFIDNTELTNIDPKLLID